MKGKINKPKDNLVRNISIQNQNVNAVKSLIKFKPKVDKSEECNPNKDENTHMHEFTSPDGEAGNIKNLIKLHLPTDKRDMMMYKQSKKLQRNYNKLQVLYNSSKESTNDQTYHKGRANSNETRKNQINLSQGLKGKHHGNSKVNSLNRKPMKLKTSQKVGNKTNRNCMKLKMAQENPPARGKSEEQKFDEFLLNESEPEESAAPNQGKAFIKYPIEDRERLIKHNKQHFKKTGKIPTTTLEYYSYVKVIGKGAFGIATLGIHKLTGKNVAIKTIKKSYIIDEYTRKKVFQEIFILKKIRHWNVIRLLEVFETKKHILLVMEYASGGDLLHFVRNVGKLPEYDTKHIFRQVLYGLAHCHWRSVMHRDIKLDNILLDSKSNIKICDFGIAKIIGRGVKVREQCGTPAYLAPEIMNEEGYEAFYPDFWGLGVLLYAMLYGWVPFKANNMDDLHKLIQKGQLSFPDYATPEAEQLIRGLIVVDPKKRLSIPEILNSAWLKEIWEDSDDSEDENNKEESTKNTKKNDEEEDLIKDIGANINYVNVDNLFFDQNYSTKLSYTDYWSVTEDYYTHHINESALKQVSRMGYPRDFVLKWLNHGELNHATATYYLLVMD